MYRCQPRVQRSAGSVARMVERAQDFPGEFRDYGSARAFGRIVGYTETRLRRVRASKRAAVYDRPDQMSIVAELPAPRNFENFHIYLHTFTFRALAYDGIYNYNRLVISNLHHLPGWRNWQTQRT